MRAAAETTHTAAERGADAVEKAVDAISDYVDSLSPYVEAAGDRVGPLAQQAKARSAAAAHQAVDALAPVLSDAREFVSPAVESARGKVQDDLLPRLSEVLERAADSDVARTATSRGAATMAALKGELELPQPKKEKKGGVGRVIRRIALVAALLGVGYVAFKKFFGPKDSGWETYQPSAPYSGSTTTTATPAEKPAEPADSQPSTAEEAIAAATSETPSGETPAESVDRVDSLAGDAAGRYGSNAYVGAEPPADFTVKGNERSMKYHTVESGGYERTIADVWFADEAAAEAAGFTKAQR
ncbi:sunset domain-containing protein [Auraticoccus monumenti]|uniref:sunset domain-containing protein n=1 Tax=Auraticoccus monumenti TaxID=675864 RepID=UPI0012FCBE96|nr:hypothetical protein [Auraticoccus monumenti]